MTKEEKARIALAALQEYTPECLSVRHIGAWRGNSVFEDNTEYPEGTIFIGPPGFVSVSENGTATPLSVYDISAPDFPG